MSLMYLKRSLRVGLVFLIVLFSFSCGSDDNSNGAQEPSVITITGTINSFGEVDVLSSSESQSVVVAGSHLVSNVSVSVSDNFLISLDDTNFSSALTIDKNEVNAGNKTVYIKFSPLANAIGFVNGVLTFQSDSAENKTFNLNGIGISTAPVININTTNFSFGDSPIMGVSEAQTSIVKGSNLTTAIDLTVTQNFEISLDGTSYAAALQIPAETANQSTTVYIRFSPTELGHASGLLNLINNEAENLEITLSGNGIPVIHNYTTFNSQRLAFGGGHDQSSIQSFNLHDDLSNIETIKMYVKLRCPSGGCDDWDVYANVKVKDPESGEMYELGRYITPYWNDNSQLERGFEFDVTDFKSLLTGSTELRIRTECWNAKGYLVTVDFDYIEGTPDYPYYAVSRVLNYDDWSSSGVPYGVTHNFDLTKTIAVPANAESTHLRTIISGWGHATPNDAGGRGCAEWCFRTHNIKINGATTFQHNLGPLGCASNPVSNQNPGNWQPDRAGWCPGMAVPTRLDHFTSSMAGSSLNFEYDYQNWTSNGQNGDAYYATSTFVVVKSNTPINKPVVTD